MHVCFVYVGGVCKCNCHTHSTMPTGPHSILRYTQALVLCHLFESSELKIVICCLQAN